jgi:hypothetical protein
VFGRKERNIIRICLSDLVSLRIYEEKMRSSLYKKLGDLYQDKYLVNKLLLRKTLFSLKICDDDFVVDYLNSFNIIVTQFISFIV